MITNRKLEEIGLRIRKRREALGFTQEKAAERLNISTTHYKNIEHGRGAMSLDVMMEIFEAFDLDPTYVLTGKEILNNPIIDFYNEIPEDKRHFMDRAMFYLNKIYRE